MIHNSTLALYFLKHFQKHCRYPAEMLDENLATDRLKLEYVAHLPGGAEMFTQLLDVRQPVTIRALSRRFGVADVLTPRRDSAVTASLLYYLGMLTLEAGRTPFGESMLNVPNLTAKVLYLEQIRELRLPGGEESDEVRRVTEQLCRAGNIQPLCEFIEHERLCLFDNRDYASANELTVKTVFLMLLAENIFYIVDSETELQRGYADLTLIVRPDMRQYQLLDILIEFKYVSLKETGLSGEQVREKSAGELENIPVIKEKQEEAEKQLQKYRTVLERKYGDALRLRGFRITAVGFERLLWAEHF